MKSLSLPEPVISQIIDDPSILNSLFNPTNLTSIPAGTSISQGDAQYILVYGYNKGFRDIFVLNASLAAFAAIVSVLLIKHKELIRADEAEMVRQRKVLEMGQKTKNEEHGKQESERASVAVPPAGSVVHTHEMDVLRTSEPVRRVEGEISGEA